MPQMPITPIGPRAPSPLAGLGGSIATGMQLGNQKKEMALKQQQLQDQRDEASRALISRTLSELRLGTMSADTPSKVAMMEQLGKMATPIIQQEMEKLHGRPIPIDVAKEMVKPDVDPTWGDITTAVMAGETRALEAGQPFTIANVLAIASPMIDQTDLDVKGRNALSEKIVQGFIDQQKYADNILQRKAAEDVAEAKIGAIAGDPASVEALARSRVGLAPAQAEQQDVITDKITELEKLLYAHRTSSNYQAKMKDPELDRNTATKDALTGLRTKNYSVIEAVWDTYLEKYPNNIQIVADWYTRWYPERSQSIAPTE